MLGVARFETRIVVLSLPKPGTMSIAPMYSKPVTAETATTIRIVVYKGVFEVLPIRRGIKKSYF
jgi:hypothetical protein